MIVSWNWLAQYVHLDMPVELLTEKLALSGLNHESTNDVGGDLAIDLEVTSNRPDCLSHIGIAREISVVFDRTLREPAAQPIEQGPPVTQCTRVEVQDPQLCPYFTARVVSGIRIGPSPWWLRKRLETVGVRSISNVVDVSNYVMLECGQPLHTYDLDLLHEQRLVIRRARAGETLQAINEKRYALEPEMLVIADADRPVGLAGVMGGLETEIHARTQRILIESARFDPVSVRKTGRALGLSSPSSFRFERGLDPARTEWASRRCAELILETAGGTLHPGVIEVGSRSSPTATITLRLDQIPRVLGIEIRPETVDRILRALGLSGSGTSPGSLSYIAPSWRPDLEREIDLIEEVGRIHGYEQIPEDSRVPLVASSRQPRERIEDAIRETLTALGFHEAVTFSLVTDALAVPFGQPAGEPILEPLRVVHASRKKESALRRSLIPSLLQARAYNAARGNLGVDLFEVANVYLPRADGSLPDEPTRIGLVSSRDFLGMKGVVQALLQRLHLTTPLEVVPADDAMGLLPGRGARLFLDGEPLGFLGEFDSAAQQYGDDAESSSVAELDLSTLLARYCWIPQAHAIPQYPAVERDLSLVMSTDIPWSEVARVVHQSAGPWLERVEFLDTFRGGNVPEGRHSLHFGLCFQHPERTLTGEEVEQAVLNVVEACGNRFHAQLRG
jgi:phenylalanyl-tRNA synthetase beta chain